MTFHQFWWPFLLITLLSAAVASFCFFCTTWMLRVKDQSVGINPFLLKAWIVVAAAGPIFFILLKVGLFR
jgi:hypothetical protein